MAKKKVEIDELLRRQSTSYIKAINDDVNFMKELGTFSLEEVLKAYGVEEVEPITVYEDMFRLGEGYIQKRHEPKGSYKANPLVYYKNKKDKHGWFRILFEDTFEEVLKEAQEKDFAILNGITYFGKKNLQEHASKMHALIIDFDGLDDEKLFTFLHGTIVGIYPMPQYLILSGHNAHLYYIFEEPLPLYPNIKLQLKEIKYALINKIWNRYTSTEEKKQFGGINQGFRIIGGKTKIEGKRVRAFSLNTHPAQLSELNDFVPEEKRIDEKKIYKETKYTKEQAKLKFPEWYERVVEKNENKLKGFDRVKKWDIAGKVNGDNPYALYDWWIEKIKSGASYGHRYYCIMVLAIYAAKCDVEEKKVKEDAESLIPYLNSLNPKEPFTQNDVRVALECYDKRYCTFPITDIVKLTQIEIKRNKRNYRSQEIHLEIARATRDINQRINGTKWTDKNGRPKGSGEKKEIVAQWKHDNPNGSKYRCQKDTGLSKNTIKKWWDYSSDLIKQKEKIKNYTYNIEYIKNSYNASIRDIKYSRDKDLLEEVKKNVFQMLDGENQIVFISLNLDKKFDELIDKFQDEFLEQYNEFFGNGLISTNKKAIKTRFDTIRKIKNQD